MENIKLRRPITKTKSHIVQDQENENKNKKETNTTTTIQTEIGRKGLSERSKASENASTSIFKSDPTKLKSSTRFKIYDEEEVSPYFKLPSITPTHTPISNFNKVRLLDFEGKTKTKKFKTDSKHIEFIQSEENNDILVENSKTTKRTNCKRNNEEVTKKKIPPRTLKDKIKEIRFQNKNAKEIKQGITRINSETDQHNIRDNSNESSDDDCMEILSDDSSDPDCIEIIREYKNTILRNKNKSHKAGEKTISIPNMKIESHNAINKPNTTSKSSVGTIRKEWSSDDELELLDNSVHSNWFQTDSNLAENSILNKTGTSQNNVADHSNCEYHNFEINIIDATTSTGIRLSSDKITLANTLDIQRQPMKRFDTYLDSSDNEETYGEQREISPLAFFATNTKLKSKNKVEDHNNSFNSIRLNILNQLKKRRELIMYYPERSFKNLKECDLEHDFGFEEENENDSYFEWWTKYVQQKTKYSREVKNTFRTLSVETSQAIKDWLIKEKESTPIKRSSNSLTRKYFEKWKTNVLFESPPRPAQIKCEKPKRKNLKHNNSRNNSTPSREGRYSFERLELNPKYRKWVKEQNEDERLTTEHQLTLISPIRDFRTFFCP